MSRSGYKLFHAKNKEEKNDNNHNTDCISLEETDPGNKFETISYTRFHITEEKGDIISIKPVKAVYWNLDSAKEWFLVHHKNKDPETNLPILSENVFRKRLEHQLSLLNYKTNENNENNEPEDCVIKQLFMRYKNGEKLDQEEMCFLYNFFHIDNTILMDWKKRCEESLEKNLDPKIYREFANELIQQSENGSWLIRQSSVKDSDVIKTRALTFRTHKGVIHHMVIAHLYGYGYALPDVFREQVMPSLENQEKNQPILISKQYVFASFIELIKTISIRFDFDLGKLIL